MISKKKRTVREALLDNTWIRDIRWTVTVQALEDFIQILKEWNYKTMWKTNPYGQPSHQAPSPPGRLRKSEGSTTFKPWQRLRKYWASHPKQNIPFG